MKGILYYTMLLLFGFLLVQNFIPIISSNPLNGAKEMISDPTLSFSNWLSGKYQINKQQYCSENFALKSDFIRLGNQLDFSLFKEANVIGTIIGKENYLYQKNYIESYYGRNFVGREKIDLQIYKLKKVQDTLARLGKQLITIEAPGKATFYPEYIPDNWKSKKTLTNPEYFTNEAIKEGINLIDFSQWFLEMKDTSQHLLYPKTGIHWSIYGACLAVDSLIKYIEQKNQIDLPEFYWKEIEQTEKYRKTDKDVEEALNLIWPIPNVPMTYPKILKDQENKTKPKTLVIADSFYWTFYNMYVNQAVFDDSEFWYYNRTIFPKRESNNDIKELNLKEEIAKLEIIILLNSEVNAQNLGWGFVEDCYTLFYERQ